MIITVSGATYRSSLQKFTPQPTERKRKGYGEQVIYEVTPIEIGLMVDLMANEACERAQDGDENTVNAIYKDMDHMLPLARWATRKKATLASA